MQEDLDLGSGVVVVTRFECGSLLNVLEILRLHRHVKREVHRKARRFIGVKAIVDWRSRTVLSVSLWEDLSGVYSMGEVGSHILATRRTGPLRVATASAIFCIAGDWRKIMFGSPTVTRSPLHRLEPEVIESRQEEVDVTLPTDHGYVVVTKEQDGTKTVTIYSDFIDGQPQHPYATHVGTRNVIVEGGVEFDAKRAAGSGTTRSVIVYADDDGAVHIAPPIATDAAFTAVSGA
jgi:hypothetical protein